MATALLKLEAQAEEQPQGLALKDALAAARRVVKAQEDPALSQDDKKQELQATYDRAWAQLHAGTSGADVQPWREVLAIASLLRGQMETEKPREALRLVDLGLILGGPESGAAPALFSLAERLAAELAEDADAGGRDAKRARREPTPGALLAEHFAELPSIRCSPEEVAAQGTLCLEHFLVKHFGPRSPLVWRGGCGHWPATRKWPQVEFWTSGSLGQRWVPVEMDYWLEEGFQLMQLHAFAKLCKEAERRPVPKAGLSGGGYLAQHALFEQLPELEADILTPDLALCGQGSLLRQVFFGPRGTVTPVHSDPYENIFCQVVGAKYLRLFAPAEASRLAPREDGELMQNNSRIEPADLLEGEKNGAYTDGPFHKLTEASFLDVVLHPGDLLYLPRGWWHYVKSLSTSISVAFHFS